MRRRRPPTRPRRTRTRPIAIDVVANDTDIDGDALTPARSRRRPRHRRDRADGTIVYTPPPNYYGADRSTTPSPTAQAARRRTVSVNVTSVNDAPTAAPKTATTNYADGGDGHAVPARTSRPAISSSRSSTPPAHGTLGRLSSVALRDAPAAVLRLVEGHVHAGGRLVRRRLVHVPASDGEPAGAPRRPCRSRHARRSCCTSATSTGRRRLRRRLDGEGDDPRPQRRRGVVSGVTVTGTWSGGATGTATCKTASTGTCTRPEDEHPEGDDERDVHGHRPDVPPTGVYIPAANHDPEVDSNGTVIVVHGP